MKLATLVLIISLCVGGTWTLTLAWHGETKAQIECMNNISKRVAENTQRIRSLEDTQEELRGVPSQIASMSSDLRFLRQLVERLMKKIDEKDRKNSDG